MQHNEQANPQEREPGYTATGQVHPETSLTDPSGEKDGRNREWEDRARVNIEKVPEGTGSMVERDFEPEQPADSLKKQDPDPAY